MHAEKSLLHQIFSLNPSYYATAFRPILAALSYLGPTWIIFCIGLSLPFSGCHCSNPTVEDEVPPTEILTPQPAPGGLPNIGGTCFIATATQLLAAVPAIRELIFHPKTSINEPLLQELQATIKRIIEGKPTTIEQMRAYCDVLSKEMPDQVIKQGNSYEWGDAKNVFLLLLNKLLPPSAKHHRDPRTQKSKGLYYEARLYRSKNYLGLPPSQGSFTMQEYREYVNKKWPTLFEESPQFIYLHCLSEHVGEGTDIFIIQDPFILTMPVKDNTSSKSQNYELVGIANTGSGHAWAYIKRGTKWYKCNDATVEACTLEQIEEVLKRLQQDHKLSQSYLYAIQQ